MTLRRTKIHTDFLAALVGVGILVTAPVLAKDHMEEGMCRHKGHHGPHHGGRLLKHFDEIDANKDGKITQDELKAHHDAKKAEADTDGDGKLSKAEFMESSKLRAEKRAARMFSHMDKNGDGFLSEDEKPAMHEKMMKRHDPFAKLDTDGDGALTKQEIEAGKAKMKDHHEGHHGGHHGDDKVEDDS